MRGQRSYKGNSRRSQSPPRRRPSPSSRGRDFCYSPMRRYDGVDLEEERRRGKYPRRDNDRRYDYRGDRDGDGTFNGVDTGRSFDPGDRDYGRGFDHRGARISGYSVVDRERSRDKGRDVDGGRFGSMYQPSGGGDRERGRDRGGDGGHFGSMYQPSGGGDDRERGSHRGGDVGGGHFGSIYQPSGGGDRERGSHRGGDVGGGHFGSMYPSGDGNYSRGLSNYSPGLSARDSASSKLKLDQMLDGPRKSEGFKSSIDHGTSNAGRNESEYLYDKSKYIDRAPTERLLVSKPMSMPMEVERGRAYSSTSHAMDFGIVPESSSQAGAVGGYSSLQSGYLNSSLRKDEDFHFCNKLHLDNVGVDGPLARDPVARREDYPLTYPRVDVHYTESSSHSKAFQQAPNRTFKEDIPGFFSDDLHRPYNGARLRSGTITNPIGYEPYGAKSRTRSPVDHEGKLDDVRSNFRSYFEIAEERHRNFAYPEVSRAERGSIGTRPTESYGKMEDLGEDHGRKDQQDVCRGRMLVAIMGKADGTSQKGYFRGNRPLDLPPTRLGQFTSDHHGRSEFLYSRRQEMLDQDYGSPRVMYSKEYRSPRMGELYHNYAIGGHNRSPHKQTDRLATRDYDARTDGFDGGTQQKLAMGNVRLLTPTLKRGHSGEKLVSRHGLGGGHDPWRDGIDSNFLSKKKITKSKYGRTTHASDVGTYNHVSSGTSSSYVHSHLKKPKNFGTRDIMKRLGPGPQKVNASQRIVKKYKKPLSKRLGPGPQKNRVTLPWLKNFNTTRLPRVQDVPDEIQLDTEEEPPEDHVMMTKPEPPESSEEFRLLVSSAFFKFVKQLNETPAKRRRYNEQEKAGSLKCIVCGSSSEEFEDTESLAIHAFTSEKAGIRSQHLGLHKALCALKGWKSGETFKSAWVSETLTHAELLSLKEDLILWPPVVIIHNSSIENQNPDQRVIVSVGEMEAKLRDVGFGDKMKVYRGKPANQSMMVVQFGGTLSGLQEAERLHKIYVESKHGRSALLKAKSCNNGSHMEAKMATIENILYGYLGIAEDLDKLDFDMKKRCVVKSKKDIQQIAEAPLKGK